MSFLPPSINRRNFILMGLGLALSACNRQNTGGDSTHSATDLNLMNVSYDVTRDFYKAYNTLFTEEYKKNHPNLRLNIAQSHGGSTKQTLAVVNGLQADVVTMNQTSDMNVLVSKGLINPDWAQALPNGAMPYTSTIVFLVRKGNPKNIYQWADLVAQQAQVIFANPKTSGSGRYAFLAAYAGALKDHQGDHEAAKAFMGHVLRNMPVLDSGARAATTTFVQRQIGDVLVAPENEAQLALRTLGAEAFEVIYPSYSITIESPVAVVTPVASAKGTTETALAYLQGLWQEPAQTLAASLFLRPQNAQILAAHAAQFPAIDRFLAQDVFGSWADIMQTYFADGGVLDQLNRP